MHTILRVTFVFMVITTVLLQSACKKEGSSPVQPPAQITPITLASGLSISSKIMIDSSAVYWAEDFGIVPYYQDDSTGVIRKVGKNGGTVTTLASGLNHPDAVLLDATHVFFIERGSNPRSNGTIRKVPKNGGAITTLATGLDYPAGANSIDATNVYFAFPVV